MNTILMIIFTIAILSVMTLVLINTLIGNKNEPTKYMEENIPFYNDITPEEEMIMLLKNIAKNQRIIKTNTTIIAIILLIPVLISIIIWATGASILSTLFN